MYSKSLNALFAMWSEMDNDLLKSNAKDVWRYQLSYSQIIHFGELRPLLMGIYLLIYNKLRFNFGKLSLYTPHSNNFFWGILYT